MNDSDSSFSQKELDKLIDEYEMQNNNFTVHMEEYSVEGSANGRFIAEFQYQGIQYQLKGIMEKAEFEKIIENLYFFKN